MIKTYIHNTEKRNQVTIVKVDGDLTLVQFKGSSIQRWIKSTEIIYKK